MKWPHRSVVAACVVLGLASPAFAAEVKLEIRDGLVTLDAKDATLREIFAEWARVGQTRVINADRISGGPITVQLTRVPERQALETLLRSAAGFLAAPRAVPQASASMYDRIMLMPGTRPAVAPTSAAAVPSGPPQSPWARERIVPPAVVVDDEDEQVPNTLMPVPGAPSGTPYGNPYNPTQPVNPNVPATGGFQRPVPPVPQTAPRPGVPIPPAPIKGPGGSGAPA